MHQIQSTYKQTNLVLLILSVQEIDNNTLCKVCTTHITVLTKKKAEFFGIPLNYMSYIVMYNCNIITRLIFNLKSRCQRFQMFVQF